MWSVCFRTRLLNCSWERPVIRKSITAQAEGHLSAGELPKFTVTADEFFGKSCSINTGRMQGGAAAAGANLKQMTVFI